jgi:hypothetical protein
MPALRRGSFALLTVAAALAGCATPDERFARQYGLSTDFPSDPELDVTAVANDTAAKVSIKDLPERAQAAYIAEMSKKTKTAAELQAALAKPLDAGAASIDRSVLARTILVTVSPTSYHPGDRLTHMTVSIVPDNFAFTGLSATATTWGSQPIDTVDVSNSLSFQPELDATLAGSAKGALKGALAASHQTDVKATIVEPFQQPTANIRDNALVFTQTGARGIDLYGTTLAKVSLAPLPGHNANAQNFLVVSALTLTGKDGLDLPAGKASVDIVGASGLKAVRYTATATLSYGIRHIVSGVRTNREDDDVVQFADGEVKVCVVLAPPGATNLGLWSIFADDGNVVTIRTDVGDRQILLTSPGDAERLVTWLAGASGSRIGSHRLGIQDRGNTDAAPRPITGRHSFTIRSVAAEGAEQDYAPGSACRGKRDFPQSGVAP